LEIGPLIRGYGYWAVFFVNRFEGRTASGIERR